VSCAGGAGHGHGRSTRERLGPFARRRLHGRRVVAPRRLGAAAQRPRRQRRDGRATVATSAALAAAAGDGAAHRPTERQGCCRGQSDLAEARKRSEQSGAQVAGKGECAAQNGAGQMTAAPQALCGRSIAVAPSVCRVQPLFKAPATNVLKRNLEVAGRGWWPR
jgi:hypothetical protein